MDQYRTEKFAEWILARLERRVAPENRSRCVAIQEMRDILIAIKETNLDAMDAEFGMPRLDGCEKCDGKCFKN